MQPTRYRILEILKEEGDATVAELARRLDMAPVSVRHHLDVLQGQNLICTPRVRRHGTVGRPQQVYALTEAAEEHFPSNLESVTERMLAELKRVVPASYLELALERVADSMAGEANPLPAHSAVEDRLQHAVEFLNQRGYLARWETSGDSFVVYNLNCPYSRVADQHPELCIMDQRLMTHLLGASATPTSRLSEGGCRCAYRVNGPAVEQ